MLKTQFSWSPPFGVYRWEISQFASHGASCRHRDGLLGSLNLNEVDESNSCNFTLYGRCFGDFSVALQVRPWTPDHGTTMLQNVRFKGNLEQRVFVSESLNKLLIVAMRSRHS